LFGTCRAWSRELLALKKKVERLKGKRRGRGARFNVVSLFQDERLTEVILEFLAETEIGRRYVLYIFNAKIIYAWHDGHNCAQPFESPHTTPS
jgi:hypothetical protein